MKKKNQVKNNFRLNHGLIAMVLIMTMVISIIPIAIAQEESESGGDISSTETLEVDSDTQTEIAIMDTKLGTGLRLLQLERAITRDMLRRQEIIKIIQAKDTNNDVTDLNEIVADMKSLIDELHQIKEPYGADAVQKFIAIKQDAIELGKEFRNIARPFLSDADIESIKNSLKIMERAEIKALNQKIIDLRRQYNADRVNAVLARIGSADPVLVEKIKSGQITHGQIISELAKKIRSMPPEARREVILKIREENTKRFVFRDNSVRERRSNRLDRRSNVAQRRSNRLQRRSDIAGVRGNEGRSDRLGNRSDAAEGRSDRRETRSDRMTVNTT